MSYTNKGFTGNDSSSDIDWDPLEVTHFQLIENTLVGDAIGQTADASGHKHSTLYHTTDQAGISLSGGAIDIRAVGNSKIVEIEPTSSSGVPVAIMFSYEDAGNNSVIEAQNENVYLATFRNGGKITFGMNDTGAATHNTVFSSDSAITHIAFDQTMSLETSAATKGSLGLSMNANDANGGAHAINITTTSGGGAGPTGWVDFNTTDGLEFYASGIKLSASGSGTDSIQITNGIAEIDFNTAYMVLTCSRLQILTLPTSSSGLPAGVLYNASGTVKVV